MPRVKRHRRRKTKLIHKNRARKMHSPLRRKERKKTQKKRNQRVSSCLLCSMSLTQLSSITPNWFLTEVWTMSSYLRSSTKTKSKTSCLSTAVSRKSKNLSITCEMTLYTSSLRIWKDSKSFWQSLCSSWRRQTARTRLLARVCLSSRTRSTLERSKLSTFL